MVSFLEFEKPIAELEARIVELRATASVGDINIDGEIGTLEQRAAKLLADTYAVYLKTHGFHWNVRGPNFSSLHALFMEEYTEMWAAIDTIAERIRALGEFAPQGYRTFANLSSISDGDPENDADGMLKTLVGDHETVIATARAALAAAQEALASV